MARGVAAAGGAAAISGFLYQLQGSVWMLIEASLDASAQNASEATLQVILEPSGGGDAIIEGIERKCIQFKQRSRPVGITDLTDAVFPDLFRAHCSTPCDRYELQSTQKLTQPAQQLYGLLQTTPLAGLENSANLQRATQACKRIYLQSNPDDAGFEQRFAEFCARLHLAPVVDADQILTGLTAHIWKFADHADKVEAKIDQLTGMLFDRARSNNGRLTPEMITESLSLGRGTEPVAALATSLQKALAARQYDVAFDIRSPTTVDPAFPVNLVAGLSGNGKSWVLRRLAQKAIDEDTPAVLIEARDRNELDRELLRHIAIDALGHESAIAATALGPNWRRRVGDPDADILVLWEGCNSAEELKRICAQGGLGQGLLLVAELPPDTDLTLFEHSAVAIRQVDEFRETEMYEALARHGLDAGEVTADVRPMLRRPVLCGIYAQLAVEDGGWKPKNEYLVLERYWDRSTEKAGSLARGLLIQFAGGIVASGDRSVSDVQIVEIGFAEEQLNRLVQAGWLSRVQGSWRFSHDRLLTWAIAKWLVDRLRQSTVEAAEIADHLSVLHNDHADDPNRLHGLGFLLMDVIWLACTSGVAAQRVAALYACIEEDRRNSSTRDFYREMLPTAGSAVKDSLLARITLPVSDDARWSWPGDIAAALKKLGLSLADRLAIERQLSEGDEVSTKLLLLLGKDWPLQTQRARVWEGMVAAFRQLGVEKGNYADFEDYRKAAVCLCRAYPDWLQAKILTTYDAKALAVGAILLRSLEYPQALAIWQAVSRHLFDHLEADYHDKLISFIKWFEASDDIPFLVEQIEAGSVCGSDAVAALGLLDPDRLLAIIATKPPLRYSLFGGRWLHRLLDHAPERTPPLLRDWLLDIDPSGAKLARIWSSARSRVDLDTLAVLLQQLQSEASLNDGGDAATLRSLLQFLGSNLFGPETKTSFEAMQGSWLAEILGVRIMAAANGAQDIHAEEAWRIVRRIGGIGHVALIEQLLDGPVEARHWGITWAIYAPTPEIIARLEAMAAHWAAEYDNGTRNLLWKTLLAVAPDRWYPEMVSLLASADPQKAALGLNLFDEYGYREDAPEILSAVRQSAPGSGIEARAINLAISSGVTHPILLERALPRFKKEGDSEGHIAACNVLLKERDSDARAQLDDYLLGIAKGNSWNSTDMQVLAIRLHQEDAGEALFAASERFMQNPSFFGEQMIEPFLDRNHPEARDALLRRAFGGPHIFTNEHSDMIETLARTDVRMAEDAFKQAWQNTPKRRRYLVHSARQLTDAVVELMLDNLPDLKGDEDAKLAYRLVALECGRRHAVAAQLILAKYAGASAETRSTCCDLLGWLPQAPQYLESIAQGDEDPEVRLHAEEEIRLWKENDAAVARFKANPSSLEALTDALELIDPSIAYRLEDEWGIVSLVQSDTQLTFFAEDLLVRRFNSVTKSRYKRVRIRPRSRSGDAEDDD